MSEPENCRKSNVADSAAIAIAAPVAARTLATAFMIVLLLGCNSRAQRDFFQQKMASEIRVLEDQLYDADYQNRVMADELERCRVKGGNGQSTVDPPNSRSSPNHSAIAPKSSVNAPIPDPIPNRDDPSLFDMEHGFDEGDLELPPVESGDPVDPESIPVPRSESKSAPQLLPAAPGLPDPPSKQDTIVPPIEPGEILPPPAGGGMEDPESDRPGKIILPDSVGASSVMPEKIQVHRGLSSGVTSNGQNSEMTIMINILDSQGRTVDLDQFNIDGELSIVLLDPTQPSTDARIGRWDFSGQQLVDLVARTPISGLQIPIQWHGDRPLSSEIMVHARLRGDEDEMRCDARLEVEKKSSIAEWTPRADEKKR